MNGDTKNFEDTENIQNHDEASREEKVVGGGEETQIDLKKKIQFITQREKNKEKDPYKKLLDRHDNRSLFVFPNTFPPRRIAIIILHSKWFERISLFFILVNCIFLALYDPMDPESVRNRVMDISEYVFTGIFTLEMVFKIFTLGFLFHKEAYLRNPWNILDFAIVSAGILEIVLDIFFGSVFQLSFLSAIRALRILRPLRAVNGLKELKIIVNSLFKSIPMLLNSFLLYFLFMLFMTILGVQIFQGVLRRRCYHNITNGMYEEDEDEFICGQDHDCPNGYRCFEKGPNPIHGYANYDNALWGISVTYTAVSTEGWTGYMYRYMDITPWASIFFLILIFCGNLFVLQLALAVITVSFGKNVKAFREHVETAEEKSEREKSFIRKLRNLFHKIDALYEKIHCCSPYTKLQSIVKKIVGSKIFLLFFIILTLLNTLTLSLDHYGIDPTFKLTLEIFNYAFVGLFTIESILKLFGLGLKEFFKDYLNLFDALIIIISYIEIIFVSIPNSGLTAFRTFRLLRAFKFLQFSKSIKRLISIVFKSITSAAMITLLLFLLIFIFALLGMQFFGGKIPTEGEIRRPNFNSLSWAIINTFIIVTGEDWNVNMDYYLQYVPWYFAYYFMFSYGVGFYIILNLFAAIMVDGFSSDDDDEEEGESNNKEESNLKSKLVSLVNSLKMTAQKSRVFPQAKEDQEDCNSEHSDAVAVSEDSLKFEEQTNSKWNVVKDKIRKFLRDRLLGDYSLCLFPPNKLRSILERIITGKIFETIIILFILLSTVILILDGPYLLPGSWLWNTIFYLNIILTALFTIEALLKIITMGLLFQKGAYLRNGWNILDFIIVVIGIFSIIFSGSNITALRAFRLLRTLRPLRFVNKIPALRIVLDCLIKSVPNILNIMLLSFFIYFIFGIIGVNFFAGKMYECTIDELKTKAECIEGGGRWETPHLNFDNVINALFTLFTISSMETWPDVMMNCIDAKDVDVARERNYNLYASIFFMIFIIIGPFFVVNLFVGVLIDNYYKLKTKYSTLLLTKDQRDWVKLQTLLLRGDSIDAKPKMPKGRFRKIVYYLITYKNIFEYAIIILVVLNIISISITHYGQSNAWSWILMSISQVFTVLFILEFVLKIIAFGFRAYFSEIFNIIDFIVIIISAISSTVGLFFEIFVSGRWASFFTVLRSLRIIRLFKMMKGVRILLKTLFISTPSIINIACLLTLIFSIFSILGVSLFGRVIQEEEFNRWANFETFPIALLTLFRSATGEDWPDIMQHCMIEEPYCSRKIGNCGSKLNAAIFFTVFAIVVFFVMMNLFVAVILENFNNLMDMSELTERTLNRFITVWKNYDTSLQFMPYNMLPMFLYEIGPPLGVERNEMDVKEMWKFINKLDLKDYGGKVHFQETLIRLSERQFGVELPDNVKVNFEKRWKQRMPHNTTAYLLAESLSALKIQRHWRLFVLQRRLRKMDKLIQAVNAEADICSLHRSLKTFDERTYDPSDNSFYNEYDELTTFDEYDELSQQTPRASTSPKSSINNNSVQVSVAENSSEEEQEEVPETAFNTK